METAIKKAIEGGYKLPWATKKHLSSMRYRDNYSVILLDPFFWKALGKSCGWSEERVCGICNGETTHFTPEWNYRWHRFIDHLAEGKDVNDFFNQLLK